MEMTLEEAEKRIESLEKVNEVNQDTLDNLLGILLEIRKRMKILESAGS